MDNKLKVLAIDPGLKNIGICGMDHNNKIVFWKILSLDIEYKKADLNNLTECLLLNLIDLFDDKYEIDTVLIENQPNKLDNRIKFLSIETYTYFNMLKILHGNIKNIRFIHAKNKLKNYYCKNLSYIQRKKLGIEVTRRYLKHYYKDNLEWFEENKKKDDLADSFLYCIDHINLIDPEDL